jgi:hypothetical protein
VKSNKKEEANVSGEFKKERWGQRVKGKEIKWNKEGVFIIKDVITT